MENGSSILYTSFKSRSPGPAFHDYKLEISSSSGDGGVLNIPHPKIITKRDVGNHTYTSVEVDVFIDKKCLSLKKMLLRAASCIDHGFILLQFTIATTDICILDGNWN